jgi:DNA-binding beta-propeller fold protein YncE
MDPRTRRSRRTLAALAAVAVLLPGCHRSGAAADTASSLPELGLAGAWAGTWTGLAWQPELLITLTVTGDWEAEVAQAGGSVSGSLYLAGDADCRDAALSGGAGDDRIVHGGATRPPCAANQWAMTALGLADRTVGGLWTQPGARAEGTFTGLQIGKVGGPRIRSVWPPGGGGGTIFTVAGGGFDAATEEVLVDVGGAPVDAAAGARPGTLTFRLPAAVPPGPVHVAAPGGIARSPRPVDTQVGAPSPSEGPTFGINNGMAQATAIAFGIDGRRAYVAAPHAGAIVDARARRQLYTIYASELTALAVSPDGRAVWGADANFGSPRLVRIDPGNGTIAAARAANVAGTWANPRGLEATPDGARLVVTAAQPGGSLTIHAAPGLEPLAVVTVEPAAGPRGVAAVPGTALVAVAVTRGSPGPAGDLRLVDLVSATVVATVAVGVHPVAVALTPDGRQAFVANEGETSVTQVDLATRVARTLSLDAVPTAVAVTPRGDRLWVLGWSSGDRVVAVLDTLSGQLVAEHRTAAGQWAPPYALAISPDGRLGYASTAGGLFELGGPTALTVAKLGTGIGTVFSDPPGIVCGAACMARFDPGSAITLTAVPDSGSDFVSWGASCPGGRVTLDASKTCEVTFAVRSGGGGGGGASGCDPEDLACVPGGIYCFIATAAYGSPMAEEVQALREFRERHLRTSAAGRAFVRAYETVSPPLAEQIRPSAALRAAVRVALWPVVQAVKHPREAVAAVIGVIAGTALWRSRRRGGGRGAR